MTTATPPRIDPGKGQLEYTELAQSRAADPATCAWVSANAGAGKTHVLKMRVLRLLLDGVPPSRILCLTYTKAAASEMATRVFEDLTDWAIADDIDLETRLIRLTGRMPDAAARDTARQLFARAIETPGGLKVQTIHGFCEQLLQRFPLEAGLRPGFAIVDDARARELVAGALGGVLAAGLDGAGPTGPALHRMIVYAADERFGELVAQAARQRTWITAMGLLGETGAGHANIDLVDTYYRHTLNVGQDATPATLEAEIASLLDDATLERAERALRAGGTTDQAIAAAFCEARKARDAGARAGALSSAFLTKALTPKKTFVTKTVENEQPALTATLRETRDRCADLSAGLNALRAIEATRALLDIATDMANRYAAAKQHQGLLDFDDLIARTVALLEAGDAARWVLFKLDGGIDHILVDEAQDTSPQQWQIISHLAEPFFDGAGASEKPRTVFAVGDEKQSIYSFQGAEPRLFGENGAHFEARATASGVPFERVPLNLSFRTVEPVLEAVDRVFANPDTTPGLSYSGATVQHEAHRVGQAGRVELWPLERPDEGEDAAPFAPLDDRAERSAITKLCERIAATIADWLATGRRLEASGKPVRPGDIMILVRNRRPIAAPMIAALKARAIPVAGADRMVLTDQLAVQDLIALGDFLTLPEDDLALANVLKSPLFDYNDADLIRLAPHRKGSLWSAMIASAKAAPTDTAAVAVLKQWRGQADFLPPFEFFSSLLNGPSHLAPGATYRLRLMRRLGPDASDPLDEFLEAALRYDDEAAPSLQGFVSWLRSSALEIKRDMDTARNEVRLMTVHGAKGLEAPIVFLPDTTTDPGARNAGSLLRLGGPEDTPAEADDAGFALETHLWTTPLGGGEPEVVADAKARRRQAAVAETNRLLYVAMTRARDELYICGNQPWDKARKKPRTLPATAWYTIIAEQLDTVLSAPDATGVRRLTSAQIAATEPALTAADAPLDIAAGPPAWAATRVAAEPRLQIPIAPSRLAPLEQDDFGDPLDTPMVATPRLPDTAATVATPGTEAAATPVQPPPAPSPRVRAQDNRFLRGNVTHALLHHLPQLAPADWQSAATAFVAQRAAGLADRARQSIISETLAVLHDPAFSHAFAAGSRAEVAIAADIPNPAGQGPSLRIAGSIDRLAVTDHNILILDFKTNRPPPVRIDDVPAAYLMQLAAYRLAVRQVFPARSVDAALLWTDGARLMPIPADQLDAAERALWTPRGPTLDALRGQT